MKLPTETLLSQIASKNEGYFRIGSDNHIIQTDYPEIMCDYYQIFYTYGCKVWDAETNELLYTKEEGVLL